VEIYLEKVRDLLDPSKDNVRVREDSSRNGRGVWLEGVTEEYAGSPSEMMALLQRGTANRAIASTAMNSVSGVVWVRASVVVVVVCVLVRLTHSVCVSPLFLAGLVSLSQRIYYHHWKT